MATNPQSGNGNTRSPTGVTPQQPASPGLAPRPLTPATAPLGQRPFLAPSTPETSRPYSSSQSGISRPVTANVPRVSAVHFDVRADLPEVQQLAAALGWLDRGFTGITVAWTELHWTTDGWKTPRVLRSTDVPCPVVDGQYFLPDVPQGTQVEFAVRVGLACHAPQDTAGIRETAEQWFNNDTQNYRQATR